MNKIFSSKLILPFSVAAIILVVGGVFAWSQMNQAPAPVATPTLAPSPIPAPTPQPAPEIPADWQTYRNEEFGFELKYPESLVDACGAIPVQLGTSSEPGHWAFGPLTIRIHSSKELDLANFVNARFRERELFPPLIEQSDPFLKNNREFIRVSYNYIAEYYFTAHNEKIFELIITLRAKDSCSIHSDIAEQMVDTLVLF